MAISSREVDTGMIDTPTDRDERWVRAIYELAGMQRPSASEGERIAAESIAGHLRELGCELVEQERAHGGYWWPIGLANGVAAVAVVAALRGLPAGPARCCARRRSRCRGTLG